MSWQLIETDSPDFLYGIRYGIHNELPVRETVLLMRVEAPQGFQIPLYEGQWSALQIENFLGKPELLSNNQSPFLAELAEGTTKILTEEEFVSALEEKRRADDETRARHLALLAASSEKAKAKQELVLRVQRKMKLTNDEVDLLIS